MTRTLLVTLTHDDARQVEAAEHRVYDGLRWLHPAVTYQVEALHHGTHDADRVCCTVCRREMDSLVSWRHRQIVGALCKPCYDHATAE